MASKNSFDCSLVSPLTQSARKIETTISLSPRAITMWLIILIILSRRRVLIYPIFRAGLGLIAEERRRWRSRNPWEERWAASLLSTTGSDCYWRQDDPPPPPSSWRTTGSTTTTLSHHGPDCWQWSWSVTMQYIMQGSQFKCYSLSHFFVW